MHQTDQLTEKLGKPIGIKSYKRFHSRGDAFLQNYLGMIGLPQDMYASFPEDQKVILLTAQAAGDPQLIEKIRKQLQKGGDVVITTGLLKLEQQHLADIVELQLDGSKALVNDFGQLYDYPQGALRDIRRVLSKDLDAYIDAPTKVSLFMYDNRTMVVENFNDEPVDITICMDVKQAQIEDLLTGKIIEAVPVTQGAATGFWGRREAPEAKFKLTLLPHSYKAFKY